MKILVCEDDIIVLKVIQIALQDKKANVIYVKDGMRALQYLKENNDFDLIITDIHMPYHNGDDILKLVREEQKSNIPIIMISSDDEEEVIAMALRSGVNEFISKPVSAEKLNRKLEKFLKN
jgi:CheY-like chemotaxis protein